ncbi:MAG: NAD(P)-binding domain-containing protein [Bacteroidetes bacterium]|nr:NAD(P)-binding domain-containing protein [Bacteroidota bacterium]
MKIGIIGAGTIGASLAEKLVRAGYKVEISNSRGPDSLQNLVAQLGPNAAAVTNEEAACNEVVILAVRWENTDQVLTPLRQQLTGKIIIDTTNPFIQNKWLFTLPKGVAASEIIASKVPGARIVKAFNNLLAKWITTDPEVPGGLRVTFISGDDEQAKSIVGKIITDLKFAPIDLGTLKDGELSQAGRALAGINLIQLNE